VSDRASNSPPNIAAVVLAAGMSRRMGRPKALLPLGDEPLIRRIIRNLIDSQSVSQIIVVTGHSSAAVVAAVSDLDVTSIGNSNYDVGGMLSSVQAGIRAAPPNVDAVMIALGDQPLVQSDTISAIVSAWTRTRALLVVPSHREKRGHPIIIASSGFAEVLALHADETLKTFVTRHENDLVELPVDDPGITTDIDTPDDYERTLHQQKLLDSARVAAVKQPAPTSMSSTPREGHDHV
jgi:molybdenum cofactor cytidylyltransferase